MPLVDTWPDTLKAPLAEIDLSFLAMEFVIDQISGAQVCNVDPQIHSTVAYRVLTTIVEPVLRDDLIDATASCFVRIAIDDNSRQFISDQDGEALFRELVREAAVEAKTKFETTIVKGSFYSSTPIVGVTFSDQATLKGQAAKELTNDLNVEEDETKTKLGGESSPVPTTDTSIEQLRRGLTTEQKVLIERISGSPLGDKPLKKVVELITATDDDIDLSRATARTDKSGDRPEIVSLAERVCGLNPDDFIQVLTTARPSKELILRIAEWAVCQISSTTAKVAPLAARLLRLTPAKQLHQVIEEAKLSEKKQERIRQALNTTSDKFNPKNAQTSETTSNARPSTIDQIDKERDEHFADATVAEVFGGAEPSVQGFRSYLKKLRLLDTDYEQKKWICRVVNFWKARLDIEFTYKKEVCNLAAKENRGPGRYWLRKPGSSQATIQFFPEFPPVRVRRRS